MSNLQTCSPEYLEVMEKKAHLVVRMLEHRLDVLFLSLSLYLSLYMARLGGAVYLDCNAQTLHTSVQKVTANLYCICLSILQIYT